jgi:hypothetical protein
MYIYLHIQNTEVLVSLEMTVPSKINKTGKGQCRGLKTKMIENQEITTL